MCVYMLRRPGLLNGHWCSAGWLTCGGGDSFTTCGPLPGGVVLVCAVVVAVQCASWLQPGQLHKGNLHAAFACLSLSACEDVCAVVCAPVFPLSLSLSPCMSTCLPAWWSGDGACVEWSTLIHTL